MNIHLFVSAVIYQKIMKNSALIVAGDKKKIGNLYYVMFVQAR